MTEISKIRVIWIEDSAIIELPQLATPFYISERYELVIADNATEAMRSLLEREFDVAIFDLRLQPGSDPKFITLYQKLGRMLKPRRLGLFMLLDLFEAPEPEMELELQRPNWLSISRVGVLSVDSWEDVGEKFERIGLTKQAYMQKRAGMSRSALRNLVDQLYIP